MKNEPAQFIFSKEIFLSIRKQDINKFYNFQPVTIGKGAFGTVYKAKHIGLEGPWRAVKTIQKKVVPNIFVLLNEIQIMITLDHPTVCKLYDIFQWKNVLYLVTDLCEGRQLFQRLQQSGTFSQDTARVIFRQIIQAVSYCHNRNIAHRDLKPYNFLFLSKKSFNLKLIDFGLAHNWEQDMKEQIVKIGGKKLVGTSYYMAPQVAKYEYDERCDIWSAGVILYMLVSALVPFDGDNDKQIIYSIRKFDYKFPKPEFQNISEQLKDLIRKIFVPDDQRITITQIFDHPWMKIDIPTVPLCVCYNKMANFIKYSKLKKLYAIYIASQFSQRQVQKLGQMFRSLDLDKNGTICLRQLKTALQKKGSHDENLVQSLHQMMNSIDTDKDGTINYTQFLASAIQQPVMSEQNNLRKMFNKLDKNNSGAIERKDLEDLFVQNGLQEYNGRSIDEIMMNCDQNGDGTVTFQQFKLSMKN